MGYRMYFEEDDAAESKSTVKSDPTASARSTIRRQRTVRYSPGVRAHQQTSLSPNIRRQTSRNGRPRPPMDRRSLLEDMRRRERTSVTHGSAQQTLDEIARLETLLGHRNSALSLATDEAHSEATNRSRMESGRAYLRDALSYERPPNRLRGSNWSRSSLRASTVSQVVGQNRTSAQDVLRGLSPPRYMATPPDTSRPSPNGSPTLSSASPLGLAEYTPGFPPAHAPVPLSESQREIVVSTRMANLASLANQIRDVRAAPRFLHEPALEMLLSDVNSRIAQDSMELSDEYFIAERDYIQSLREHLEALVPPASLRRQYGVPGATASSQISDLPPLSRTNGTSGDWTRPTSTSGPRDDVDGLGDRARSSSPETVSWETMLSTIAPDDRVPSTHSSFYSNTTSTSAVSRGTNSGTASTYGTSFSTPPTTTDADPCPAGELDISDSDSHSGSHIEDIGETAPHRRRTSQEIISRADRDLERIRSLSRRVDQQRARGEFVARHRRMIERERELQRMEATLQALERQIEEERSNAAESQISHGMRAGRERL